MSLLLALLATTGVGGGQVWAQNTNTNKQATTEASKNKDKKSQKDEKPAKKNEKPAKKEVKEDFKERNIGTFGVWTAKVYYENKQKVCHIWSRAQGKDTEKVIAFITHRPDLKRYNEVSFTMPGPLNKELGIAVIIDKKDKYDFFGYQNSAFYKENNYSKMIDSMKKGKNLAIDAQGIKAEKFKYNFEINGIVPALKAIDKECPNKWVAIFLCMNQVI